MSTPLRPKVMMSRSVAMVSMPPASERWSGGAFCSWIPPPRFTYAPPGSLICLDKEWAWRPGGRLLGRPPPGGGRAGSGPRFGLTQPRAGSELPRQELRPAHAEGPVLEAVLDHRDDQILRAHQIGSRQALGERGIGPLLLLGGAADRKSGV